MPRQPKDGPKMTTRWTQDDHNMAFKMTTRWLQDYSSSQAFREERLPMNHHKHPYFTGSGRGVKAARAIM